MVKTRDKKVHIDFPTLIFFISMAEIILCGSGRIIVIGGITERYILFFLNLCCAVYLIATEQATLSTKSLTLFSVYFVILLAAIFKGIILNGIGSTLQHSKGYLFALYFLPAATILNSKERVKELFRLCDKFALALAFIIVVLFLLLSVNFNRFYAVFNPILLRYDIGHIVNVGAVPRVFFKCVPYCAIFAIYRITEWLYKPIRHRVLYFISILIMIAAVITSFTMGLWLAFAVGVFIVFMHYSHKNKLIFLSVCFIGGCLVLALFGSDIFSVLGSRLSSSDTSGIIKAQQFKQMIESWLLAPIFGHGFGESITFVSGAGTRTMLTIENTWLEILNTMGVVGLIAFLCLILYPVVALEKANKIETDMLSVKFTIIGGVFILIIVSAFNPFINNPIGLAFVGVCVSSVSAMTKRDKKANCAEGIGQSRRLERGATWQ